MKLIFFFLLVSLSSILTLNAQNTYVPDNNFEQRLIDLGYDDVLDDYVLTANISGVTSLDIQNKSVNDVTGLQDFASLTKFFCDNNNISNIIFHPNVNLEMLWCQNNNIAQLDLSAHNNLTRLVCSNNNISTLDLSNNPNLENLYVNNNNLSTLNTSLQENLIDLGCSDNNISTLDLSNNPNLKDIYVSRNNLSTLNTSLQENLRYLTCQDNNITELNVSNNINLIDLFVGYNQLTELDVTSLTNLEDLECSQNSIIELDLSQNLVLKQFYAGDNSFSELDLSYNTQLQEVRFNYQNTALQTLDVRNGNNTNILDFAILNAPNLPVIYVDDCNYSTANWTDIDATTTFVEMEGQTECEPLGIGDFLTDLEITVYPNPASERLFIKAVDSGLANGILYDITGKLISNFQLNEIENKIDVSNIASGIYFMEISNNKNSVVKKIVIE